MSIFRKSYAEIISEVRIMIDALNRVGSVPEDFPMGLGETFIDELIASREKVVAYNTEKEKLNADLTAKSMQLDDEMKKMRKLYSEAKERVKQDVPQEQWEEFGITDKK
ncbi:MAG: hypothetical protein PHO84_08505 [Dysgonamonadaceae bacterium]|nr:hypothetical protein [Dysgonamonadaceae bacterium]MDD4247174.1 hypothetical protein [Dysgonamonadaceae bacterium]MDD4606163.1 hypothetical protein [Dysgonamonadaceae bacterium]